jgi:hypothetical protein
MVAVVILPGYRERLIQFTIMPGRLTDSSSVVREVIELIQCSVRRGEGLVSRKF